MSLPPRGGFEPGDEITFYCNGALTRAEVLEIKFDPSHAYLGTRLYVRTLEASMTTMGGAYHTIGASQATFVRRGWR